MEPFSATGMIRWGWETFGKRPLVFVGFALVLGVVSWLIGADAHPGDPLPVLTAVAGLIVAIFLDMGATAFMLKAHDALDTVTLADLWHPDDFWNYLLASALSGIAIIVGLVLLIVPGIIAAIAFLFVKFLVIDRHLEPIAAMKESARMTKGHRFELFVLVLLLVGLNILGMLLAGIGMLVTIPLSALALVRAYRLLATPTALPVAAPL